MGAKDYYAILQIDPAATEEEVRAAYKRLALLCHPDLSTDPRATLRMQLLNEAYDVLKSQDERQRYDLERLGPPPAPAPPESQTVDLDKTRPVRVYRREPLREREQKQAMLNSLKALAQLILLMTVWFIFSLAAGKVDLVGVAVFVVLGVYIIASLVMKGKGLTRS